MHKLFKKFGDDVQNDKDISVPLLMSHAHLLKKVGQR